METRVNIGKTALRMERVVSWLGPGTTRPFSFREVEKQPDEPVPDSIPTPGEPKPPGTPPDFPEIPRPGKPQSPFPAHPRADRAHGAPKAQPGAAPEGSPQRHSGQLPKPRRGAM